MQPESNAVTFDVMELLMRLLHRWFVLLLCGLLVGVGVYLYSTFAITPKYEASCRMLVITREDANNNVTADQLTSAEGMIKTYSEIIRGRDFLETVVLKGLGDAGKDMTYQVLQGKISVTAVTDTQIMTISVRDTDVKKAKKICEKIYSSAPAYTKSKGKIGSMEQLDSVHAESTSVYPNIRKNTLIGFGVGVAIPVLVILLQMLLENTYKNDIDLKNDLDLPVLGIIPSLDPKENRSRSGNRARSEKEAQ